MGASKNYLPIFDWLKDYNSASFSRDLLAAAIVTSMLIPQSLAYALLAGMPAEAGLYASMAPLIAYAVFGSSRTLSVGPVAIASLMSAAALGEVAQQGSENYLAAATLLALFSGLFLLLLGWLRLGFLASFLSHPVISGFITAAGILIAFSQLKHLLGVEAGGHSLPQLIQSMLANLPRWNPYALGLGLGVSVFLLWARRGAVGLLTGLSASRHKAVLLAKAAPLVAIVVTVLLTLWWDLEQKQVALVGAIPAGLPLLSVPDFIWPLAQKLLLPALMISIIGYVESVSVGKTLAAKRRQKSRPTRS